MWPECITRRSRHAAMAVAATLLLLPATPAPAQQAGGGATEVGVMTLESRYVLFRIEDQTYRTEIRSPIAGFPSVPTISVGALVTENQTDALTTVARLDPIYVDVEESIRRMGEIRDKMDAGALQPGDGLDIELELESGGTYAAKGRMVSPGTTVSTTTGTRRMRIAFDNPELRLMPGQVLRVEVVLGTTNAVLAPQGATSRSASGVLTAFVAVDGKAEQRELTEQGSYRNARGGDRRHRAGRGADRGRAHPPAERRRGQHGAGDHLGGRGGHRCRAAEVDGAADGSGPGTGADALTGQSED